jgi:hypothetical protein
MASTVASTFTSMTSSGPTEKLRYPFQVTYDTSAYAAGLINKSCDKTISFTKSGVDGVVKMTKPMREKLQPYVTDMSKKCKPYTDQVTPYIKSIPYMDTAKNNAPLMFALTVIAVSLPIMAGMGIFALLTFPVWGFFAFITAFLWVPAVLVGTAMIGCGLCLASMVCVVRYFSNPKTKAMEKAKAMWTSYTGSGKMVHKIFYVPITKAK